MGGVPVRGHQQLIAVRQRGLRPQAVALHVSDVGPCQAGEALEIVVAPDEAIDRLDLRCLVGLDVIVAAEREDGFGRTVRALCMAAVDAGAKRVLGIEWKRAGATTTVFSHGVH